MPRAEHIHDGRRLMFFCPGCREYHHVTDSWRFNGDYERPTITPSVRVSDDRRTLCHSFVRDGQIQFLSDCAHELAGQTVDLPELEQ